MTIGDVAARRLPAWGMSMAVLSVGLAARAVAAATSGPSYDMESYRIVAGLVDHHLNVYSHTFRYNYGPLWFLLLGLFRAITADHLRVLVVALLSLVDVAIWAVMRRRWGAVAAALFFLNPVQILITGRHNQFDNLAILFGLLAVVCLDSPRRTRRSFALALLLLGLSLITKHLLFLFPLWVAVSERGLWRRTLVLLVPPLMFGLSFVPFLGDGGRRGIIEHVVRYRSFNDAPLLHAIGVTSTTATFRTFILALLVFSVAWRHRSHAERLLLYTLVLVVFSPAVADQYLAIVGVAIGVLLNPAFVAFVAIATPYLLGDLPSWLPHDRLGQIYRPLILALGLGLLLVLVQSRLPPSLTRLMARDGTVVSRARPQPIEETGDTSPSEV